MPEGDECMTMDVQDGVRLIPFFDRLGRIPLPPQINLRIGWFQGKLTGTRSIQVLLTLPNYPSKASERVVEMHHQGITWNYFPPSVDAPGIGLSPEQAAQ